MLNQAFENPGGKTPGLEQLAYLLNPPLSDLNAAGAKQPWLAETLPSVENGLWRVFPDGRMETIWKIRPGILWHDGTPFTAEDVAFTAMVLLDKEMPVRPARGAAMVESVQAVDPLTVTVVWKRPYIEADFDAYVFEGGGFLPAHLLTQAYLSNRATFSEQSYFRNDFVGTGAFKLKEFVLDSHVTLSANDTYVFGRPQIDEIEVRFIPDPRTIGANVLAGHIDITLGDALSVGQAVPVRDQWPDGRMIVTPIDNYFAIYPQFVDPQPAVVGDARFRKALMHAIDRQALADALQYGLAPVAHSVFPVNHPLYPEIEASLVKYEYDPRKAIQIIEGLGYRRGGERFFRDAADQRLQVELWVLGNLEKNVQTSAPVADYWQEAGVQTEPFIIPPQRASDRQWRQARPAFELYRHTGGMIALVNYQSSAIPANRSPNRYSNPEYDAMVDTLFTTISTRDQLPILRQIVHTLTDQLVNFTLYNDVLVDLVSNRTVGFANGRVMINAHEWSIRA
jgi:peptide/nickel transport system substrate-binding protein